MIYHNLQKRGRKKHLHFTGICGTLIAPLAVAMKAQGWKVTGSDMAFYPPMSTYLLDNKIKIIPGYNPDKFKKIGLPDLAMMMSFLNPDNPEIKYLKSRNVEIISLGQLLERFFIKKNSIVVTGNYGKTSITALLSWILETAGMNPSVFVKSDWSVSEGDEFKNWDISRKYKFTRRARLFYQKPTHVVFTDATWDHYDQYPTKEEYLNTFIKFIKQVPKSGFVVGNGEGKNVREVLEESKAPTKLVKLDKNDIKYLKDGSEIVIEGHKFKTPMLGRIGAVNTALAITLALNIGISASDIQKALRTFKGVKRRQEVRFKNKHVTVIDDFAHSPVKLRGLIDAMRLHYPKDKIILIYQPGNKDKIALGKYSADTFAGVDYVVLPKVSSMDNESRLFNALLANKLKKTKLRGKVTYIGNDDLVVKTILERAKQFTKAGNHTIILFAAQKGFRGIIEETVISLRQLYRS